MLLTVHVYPDPRANRLREVVVGHDALHFAHVVVRLKGGDEEATPQGAVSAVVCGAGEERVPAVPLDGWCRPPCRQQESEQVSLQLPRSSLCIPYTYASDCLPSLLSQDTRLSLSYCISLSKLQHFFKSTLLKSMEIVALMEESSVTNMFLK